MKSDPLNFRVGLIWLILAVAGPTCFALGNPSISKTGFVHPGGLHTRADLDRMKTKVSAREHPWIDGWNQLIADKRAQNNYRASPKPNMGVSRQRAQDDAASAYLNALRWQVSGDRSYADCAVRNLNGWSTTVNVVPGGNDQPGLGGIPIGTFALAAELLRDYPGWQQADQERFKAMLLTYFYPVVNDFLTHHRGAHPTSYWANWDAANVLSLVAIGVYCDDRKIFDEGVEYYKNGIGMGSIKHAVPFLYPDGLGQWQESGRDHAHAFGGLGLLVEACQVAWNQGVDLFGYDNDRILAGASYEAQYAQWIGVPYTFYTNADQANQYYISTNYRGRLSNCEFYELLYNHYAIVKGRPVPEVERFAKLLRPEGGNVDLIGYGTLTATLDATRSPMQVTPPPTPQDLTATAGVGKIDLKWSPSGAYLTQGYEVLRAITADGPYASVFSTKTNTTPAFVDTKVEGGNRYFYRVIALNQAGRSGESEVVNATVAKAGDLPKGWLAEDIGKCAKPGLSRYAEPAGGTFILTGGGIGIGGQEDGCQFSYMPVRGDFTLTARVIERSGRANKVGLMLRESTASNASMAAITLGEVGGRQARFNSRSAAGEKTRIQRGNDYTWLPVWFRLQRVGNTVTGSQSSDGTTWFIVGKTEIKIADSYLVGMAVTSATASEEMATVTFDHVQASPLPPPVPSAPDHFNASSGPDSVTLTWARPSEPIDGIRIESSQDGKLFYEIAELSPRLTRFVHTGTSGGSFYRIRFYTNGGLSPYSKTVRSKSFSGE